MQWLWDFFKKKLLKEIFTSGQHGHKFWMHSGKSLYSLSSCYCNTSLYLYTRVRMKQRTSAKWLEAGGKAGHRLSHRLETQLLSAFSATHLAVSHINNINTHTAGVTFRCGKVKLGVLQIAPAGKHWNNGDLELNKQKTVRSTATDTNLVEELDRSSYWTRFSEVVEPFKWQFSVPWKQSQRLVRSRANTSFLLARVWQMYWPEQQAFDWRF